MSAKARPILFMGAMVRAILAGDKDVTRRVGPSWAGVRAGERLWVRETWAPADSLIGLTFGYDRDPPSSVVFRADHHAYICNPSGLVRADDRDIGDPPAWRPSIFMPRWACRLELDVVSVTEQRCRLLPPRLPDLTEDEVRREGFDTAEAFLNAWLRMHGAYEGPVYRVEFTVATPRAAPSP